MYYILYLLLCRGNRTDTAPLPDLFRYPIFWLYRGSSTERPTEISKKFRRMGLIHIKAYGGWVLIKF
jgi:hypothetical protein